MIRINRQTDYAIRVLLALAEHRDEARRSTSEIRREMLIPPALAQRVVADLARGGFIVTYAGRDGGLELARPPEQINLRQVVEFFEGPITISDCMITEGECPFDDKCPVRRRWARLQGTIADEMENVTLSELAKDASLIEAQEGGSP